MGTNEYQEGYGASARQMGFRKEPEEEALTRSCYRLPEDKGRGYILQLQYGDGLYVALGDYVLREPFARSYDVEEPCAEIYYLESGDIRNTENGKKTQRISRGVNVYASRGQKGKVLYGAQIAVRFITVALFGSYVQERIRQIYPEEGFDLAEARCWPRHFYDTPELALVFMQMKERLQSGETNRMYFESKLGEILMLIRSGAARSKRAGDGVSSRELPYLLRVKAELESRPTDPPTLEELCRLAGMGQTKLKALFKAAFGRTLHGCLKEARMKRALLLLADESLSIKQVAALVGMENAGKFAVLFRETFGRSPAEYRRSMNRVHVPKGDVQAEFGP